MSLKENDDVEILTWDSDFFGFKIAKVRKNIIPSEKIDNIFQFCRDNNVRCLYFLADISNSSGWVQAQERGFARVDIRTTLSFQGGGVEHVDRADLIFRPFESSDLAEVIRISDNIYEHSSRFYADPNFSRHFCNRMYLAWIEKLFQPDPGNYGYLAIDSSGRLAGYILGTVTDNRADMSLVAVAREFQSQGVGKYLVRNVFADLSKKGISNFKVVTQGSNKAALKVYQSCGFDVVDVKWWYHKWF